MRTRINLLALMVLAAGGAIVARPTPAGATYLDPWQTRSCCWSVDAMGRRAGGCCGASGCMIKVDYGCLGW